LKKEQFMKNETSTMSYILRAFGILPLLAILAASFCPAHAAQLQVNSNIPFTCASVQGGNTANGTPVILYSCGDGPPQQWNYIDGQLQGIGTANGVTTCLEANGSTSGSKVVLSACNGGQNQQWYFQDNNVVVVEGNLCLDSSPGLGNQLVVNACTPATSQNWIVRGMEIQLNSDAPYVCFSVDGSLAANGTQVLSYSCAEGPAELWYFESGQIVGLGTNGTKTKCLAAGGTTPGSLVEISACTGGEKQKWLMVPGTRVGASSSAAVIVITFGDRNLCVDSSGGQPVGDGTQLVLNTCTAVASQNWIVR
jgi:WD40 repeat protein